MPSVTCKHPFYPIIYVRGYAGSQGEVEDTVADPYMGFNIGATKIRQTWDRRIERQIFESPLVRLMKDYQYRDVYEAGEVMPSGLKLGPCSVFIYRYYDHVSEDLGPGERLEIEDYASGLGRLILDIKKRMCNGDPTAEDAFRVYLVAHSMGGLICRSFLQKKQIPGLKKQELNVARAAVDKVFTYATPHNGIDLRILGNVPGFFSRNNSDNFNRNRMIKYLGLPKGTRAVATLGPMFDPERFFCLVGTNHKDYTVGMGGVRTVVGPMSDGLVLIRNATVVGEKKAGTKTRTVHCPRAFVHRSHSGHYGIVNSEGGYQNLTRFLFGNVRVDAKLEIQNLFLPDEVERAHKKDNKDIRASYHFEVIVRTRGATWDLHRRTVAEDSAIHRKYDELFTKDDKPRKDARSPQLFSTYLSKLELVNAKKLMDEDPESVDRLPLGFSVDLGVMVPQYEVDGFLMFDDHYDGGYLYREKLNFEVVPPDTEKGRKIWALRVGTDSKMPNRTSKTLILGTKRGRATEFRIPIGKITKPGIKGELVLTASEWNRTARVS